MLKKIALNEKNNLEVVDIKDIIYFEKEKKYIKVLLRNNKIIYIKNSIKKLQNTLEKEDLFNVYFFKPHCSYIINLIHIIDLDPKFLIMSNKDIIPISASQKKMFYNLIMKEIFII